MTHQVGQKGDVSAAVQKALGKPMAKGVGIDHIRVDSIAHSQFFQLGGHPTGGDTLALPVEKDKAAGHFLSGQPLARLLLKSLGDIDAPQLAPLGVQVQIAQADVLGLQLKQLADAGPGGRQEPDHKIPEELIILLQTGLKILIIRLADDVFQKSLLLHPHKGQPLLLPAHALQIAVDGLEPQVHRLGLIALHQPALIPAQVGLGHRPIALAELPQGEEIGRDGVLREMLLP